MLQIALIFIGFVGLIKRKIKISSKKEITGTPVIALSLFYLLFALLPLFFSGGYDFISIGILFFVTLFVVFFYKE